MRSAAVFLVWGDVSSLTNGMFVLLATSASRELVPDDSVGERQVVRPVELGTRSGVENTLARWADFQ